MANVLNENDLSKASGGKTRTVHDFGFNLLSRIPISCISDRRYHNDMIFVAFENGDELIGRLKNACNYDGEHITLSIENFLFDPAQTIDYVVNKMDHVHKIEYCGVKYGR